jgi:hypothetical protein
MDQSLGQRIYGMGEDRGQYVVFWWVKGASRVKCMA